MTDVMEPVYDSVGVLNPRKIPRQTTASRRFDRRFGVELQPAVVLGNSDDSDRIRESYPSD